MIRTFEATIGANKLVAEGLNTRLEEVDHQLILKEKEIKELEIMKENLDKDKSDLQLSNENFARQLATSMEQIENLEAFINVLAQQLGVFDKNNLVFIEKFDELNILYDSCFKLVHQEKYLVARHSQIKYKQLHEKFVCITSERDALQLANNALYTKITELQKAQESVLAQLSEEYQLAGKKIQRLESEAESLLSNKKESAKMISELEDKICSLSETSRSSENKLVRIIVI